MWLETARILEKRLPDITGFMERCRTPGLRVCIAGAGSSGYCGEIISAAANKYLGYISDAPHTTDIVGSPESFLHEDIPTLLISLARSGNSPESAGAVEYARKKIKRLFEICVTCSANGELFKISEENKENENILNILLPEKTCDKGFAMTSSFTSMAVAAYGILSYNNFPAFKNDVSALGGCISESLNKLVCSAQKTISEKPFDRAAFLGAGIHKGLAREAANKMGELTAGKINVVSDTPLEFRHGPKSMVDDNTVIMHIISEDLLTRKYDIDLLCELISQKRENKIITVSAGKPDVEGIDYEIILNNNFSNDFYFGIAGAVFAQIFAFIKSQEMGITTDNPCPGGDLNREVKGVTIYEI